MPCLEVIGQQIKEKRRWDTYTLPLPAYMVPKYPSLNRVKFELSMGIHKNNKRPLSMRSKITINSTKFSEHAKSQDSMVGFSNAINFIHNPPRDKLPGHDLKGAKALLPGTIICVQKPSSWDRTRSQSPTPGT